MSGTLEALTVFETIETVFDIYEQRKVDELLSTQKGASRFSTDQIQGILGKAQAGRELRATLMNELGFSV